MRLTFLGKETQGGGSPTLFATDRDTYVVQGWTVADEPPTVIEIPESLLCHLQPNTELAVPLQNTGRRWRGDNGECETYILAGAAVTDSEALSQMNVPGHESCVEVGRQRKDNNSEAATRPGV
jgi:hypothetical protein